MHIVEHDALLVVIPVSYGFVRILVRNNATILLIAMASMAIAAMQTT
jgi:hypothetical protein